MGMHPYSIPDKLITLSYEDCKAIGLFRPPTHIKVMIRREYKKCIASTIFWKAFPEYEDLKMRYVGKMTKRVGCCAAINPELETEMSELVMANPEKWKQYMNATKIQLFYGKNPRRSTIL